MKILIFGGSGNIGSASAWNLAKDKDVEAVGIVGRRKEALENVKRWINSDKIFLHPLDITKKEETKKLMKQYDSGIISLPDRRTSYTVVDLAFDAGLNIVDVLEEYHRRPDAYETEGLELPEGIKTLNEYGDHLHNKAIQNDTTLVDGIGFAPGLSNITTAEGIRKMDKAESAIARVGGIPSKEFSEKHPLRYMITWSFRHVLREYMVKVNVLKNGNLVEVDAMSDYEKFKFEKFGKSEELECFITPGMPSFIFTRPELKEFAEKTIRWPGHWQGIQTLKECGLLSMDEINFQGMKIKPRDFLLSVIEPKLMPSENETDVCVMWNTVKGKKNGKRVRIDYYMWDEADTENKISSMSRVTGFPASIAAKYLAKGKINQKGIIAPEDCIKGKIYDEFMAELEKRNIKIMETQTFF